MRSKAEGGRIGVYGWGVVAPGAKNVTALEQLLRSGRTALRTASSAALGDGLFAVGDPAFSMDDYVEWIAARKGEPYATRLKKKMGDNVLFTLGATIQALQCDARLEGLAKEFDESVHVYVGSGVGDLPQTYEACRSLDRATREWNHFWADPIRCPARARFAQHGELPPSAPPPPADPASLPVDSEQRFEARIAADAYWAEHSGALKDFMARFKDVEKLGGTDSDNTASQGAGKAASDKAHLDAIRRRVRAMRNLLDETGCPPPPWSLVRADLIWNIQNAPAAQVTMLLDIHGPAWAPVGACSTFGVALKCGYDAIRRGEAKMAIIGTTDPRPDPALVGAFYEARVMGGTGEVNVPFTQLRGTHISGGSCIWILGDEQTFAARGLNPVGGWVEGVALSSDAEHIITPSVAGPKRAIKRAFEQAGIDREHVQMADLHATGTPGDLNELSLVEDFISETTRITARKGQLGHGMANSGGWELTALAMSLNAHEAISTGIDQSELHANIRHPSSIVCGTTPLEGPGGVGFKMMLGIGGITSCVVLRASR